MIERGDVVVAAFPFVETADVRRRPALVISDGEVAGGRLLWVLMITGSALEPWPGDVLTGVDYPALGLKRPSIVRTSKIAAIESETVVKIGRLPAGSITEIEAALRCTLAL